MIEIETHAHLKIEETDFATKPLQIDDWWISTTDKSPSTGDTNLRKSNEEEVVNKHFERVYRKVSAVRKDSMRVTLQGEVKTLLQQWECVVLGTDSETVHCEMHDLTDEANPIEFAELLWSEFNEYDVPLLQEGAVFYWSIGHLRKQSGQVRRFSETRLRRMPKLGAAKRREIARKVEILDGLSSGKS